jgi:hypothetical protein
MSTAQAVTQHLPFLRRYARALAGSQQSGDAYVTAALEALIADPTVVSLASSPRVALYQLFTKIWNSVDVNVKSEPPTDPKMPVEQRLGHITPLPRQAFLLVALEGFQRRTRRRFSISMSGSCARWSSSPAASLPLKSPPTYSSSRTRRSLPWTSRGWLKTLVIMCSVWPAPIRPR